MAYGLFFIHILLQIRLTYSQYNQRMDKRKKSLVVGIAGGSGSGKTTLANMVVDRVGKDFIAYLPHDAYYKDLSDLPPNQRSLINFDHPNSLDSDLLVEHIVQLLDYTTIYLPIYNFKQHIRTTGFLCVEPKPVILVEGILLFVEPALRSIFDVKIFVDTDSDIRFIRRLERDIAERGRSMDSVIQQYLTTVRPMHLEFVESSKRYADIIVPEGGLNTVAMEMVVARLEALIRT